MASALGAITMVAGFIAFTETFQSREMDRRLLLVSCPGCRYCWPNLLPSPLLPPCCLSTPRSCCGSLCPSATQHPWRWPLRVAGLAYGGIGLLLGSLVRGELEGFFLIIMLSLVDTGLQNPVFNTLMDVAGVSALPLYGVNQLALSSTLTPHIPWSHGLLSLTWSAATGALALLVLHTHRTSRSPRPRRARVQAG